MTNAEYNRLQYWSKLGGKCDKPPKLFPIVDHALLDSDLNSHKDALEGLTQLGINRPVGFIVHGNE